MSPKLKASPGRFGRDLTPAQSGTLMRLRWIEKQMDELRIARYEQIEKGWNQFIPVAVLARAAGMTEGGIRRTVARGRPPRLYSPRGQ